LHLSQPAPKIPRCPLRPESARVIASQRNDAMYQTRLMRRSKLQLWPSAETAGYGISNAPYKASAMSLSAQRFWFGSGDLREQRLAELVKVDLDGVARRALEPPMRMLDIPFYAGGKI